MPNDSPAGAEILEFIKHRMDNQKVVPQIHESFKQHYENLTRLATDLQKLGMDQQQIDEHVSEIFKEYERELAANIRRIESAANLSKVSG